MKIRHPVNLNIIINLAFVSKKNHFKWPTVTGVKADWVAVHDYSNFQSDQVVDIASKFTEPYMNVN